MAKLLAGVVVLALMAVIFLRPDTAVVQLSQPVQTLEETVIAPQSEAEPVTRVVEPEATAEVAIAAKEAEVTDYRPEFDLDEQAIESLRDSLENGDPRAPALNRSRQRDEVPTAAQLEDPDLYAAYERRQQNRVYRAYVEASKVKVAELEKMIERGKREGVSEEQIKFAEDKIAGIKNMAAELQRDHPEIMQDDLAPKDDWLVDNLGVSDPQPQHAEKTQ